MLNQLKFYGKLLHAYVHAASGNFEDVSLFIFLLHLIFIKKFMHMVKIRLSFTLHSWKWWKFPFNFNDTPFVLQWHHIHLSSRIYKALLVIAINDLYFNFDDVFSNCIMIHLAIVIINLKMVNLNLYSIIL